MEVAPCIELIPGANYYIVPEKAMPIPSDFVDLNTYYYLLINGQMRLKGIALGPGWELRNFDAKKLSCYKQKGEGEMVKKLDWETLGPQIDELRAQGKTIKAIAEELGIGETTTQRYLANKKQTPTPEPVQAANQEPVQEEKEPATEIIPDKTAYYAEPVNMPIGCSLPLENTTEAEQEEMAKCDTIQDEGAGEYISADIAKDFAWPPNDAVEKALLEATINAHFAVRRVLNDPVALALMKQVLESGAV